MLARRIIAALDVRGGRTVKGVKFENIRDAGDPIELALRYSNEGIDELVYLDIAASEEERSTFVALVKEVARNVSIPFCVGGGIRSVADVARLINAGADKVFINSAALLNPALITEAAKEFGTQCILLAVDAGFRDNCWRVYTHGGKRATDRTLFEWCKEATERGAGEILFTSMDHDGAKQGYALEPLRTLASMLSIPVIASGGAGTIEHFKDVFTDGMADAALAASVFHYGEISIPLLKKYLQKHDIPMRA